MSKRVASFLVVALACLGLAAAACGKKDEDKKGGDTKTTTDTGKKEPGAKVDPAGGAADTNAEPAADGSGDFKAIVDKFVKLADEMCACQDKECAKSKDKEWRELLYTMPDGAPPDEIHNKFMSASDKQNTCYETLTKW